MNLRFVAFLALICACLAKEKRSIGWFAPATESPLSKYPVWKVHKYTGIDLKPVNVPLKTHEFDEEHVGEILPEVIDIPNFSTYENHHDDIEHLSDYYPRSFSDYFEHENVEKEADDKIGVVPSLILKKKKKQILGLLALSSLLKAGKVKIGKGGIIALINGLLGGKETPETLFYPGQTTVYRDIPEMRAPSFLSKIPFIEGHFGKGSTVHLPEPELPDFPALKLVPELPKIPKLNLPGPYKVPYSTGSYVRIKVPHPIYHEEKHEFYSPPATSYGVPEHFEHESAPYPAHDHTVHQSFAPYPPNDYNVHQSPYPAENKAIQDQSLPFQTPIYKHDQNELEYGLPSPVPGPQFAPSAPYPPSPPSAPYPPSPPSAPYPPPPPPSPPAEYGMPNFNQKYTGPSSYQTTFDSAPYASEPEPIVVAAPKPNVVAAPEPSDVAAPEPTVVADPEENDKMYRENEMTSLKEMKN